MSNERPANGIEQGTDPYEPPFDVGGATVAHGAGAWLDPHVYDAGTVLNSVRKRAAVIGWQRTLLFLGAPWTTPPAFGTFDPTTEGMVRWFQNRNLDPKTGLRLTVDGQLGPLTGRTILVALARQFAPAHGVPSGLLCGLMRQESDYDCGAQGFDTPSDFGPVQINTSAFRVPETTACSPLFALPWAADRMFDRYVVARERRPYGTTDFAWRVAVLNHNSPVWAQYLQEYGDWPPAALEVTGRNRAQVYVESVFKGIGA